MGYRLAFSRAILNFSCSIEIHCQKSFKLHSNTKRRHKALCSRFFRVRIGPLDHALRLACRGSRRASFYRRSFLFEMEVLLIQKSFTGEAPEPSRTLSSNKPFKFSYAPKSAMFSSCIYCGRTHAEGYICSKKPIKRRRINDAVRFRNSAEWQAKR